MKAIIPAAGHGTRFLPVTRVIPKEMLPIGAKPALELIVEEAKSAGADEIVMVISKGKELIREYFKDDPSIAFVYQPEQKGLGHAVLQAEEALGEAEGNVLILLGDALVAGCNAAQAMAAVSAEHGGAGVIGLECVPPEKVSRYGIVKPGVQPIDQSTNRTIPIVDLMEKPRPEEAPSDLAIAGRYLLPARIFDYLKTQVPGRGGEIQLTDAIRRMVRDMSQSTNRAIEQSNNIFGYIYPGKRQDIGNPLGYLDALLAMRAASQV